MKCEYCGIEQEDIMSEGEYKNGPCCSEAYNDMIEAHYKAKELIKQ